MVRSPPYFLAFSYSDILISQPFFDRGSIPLILSHSTSLHIRPNSVKANFKKPGKDGMNIFRGVMISGPPGIGKTTSAHLVAKLAGFTPIELNASDTRSKKLVEVCVFLCALFFFFVYYLD